MAIFKCKMCGGTLEFNPGDTVGTCDSCGTKQTLPRLDNDRKTNLYDRADHFRRSNDFDKAMGIYEQILNEDRTDAEAYWSLVLCRYGIEYVEDPLTHKRIPTVNRTQYTSIFADEDYKSALHYADEEQRKIYEQEAEAIDTIQKGILAISNNEEPFDVFICYKETDAQGRRTHDSVLATDLYHQLVREGYKVFFSRITLEDKLGVAYEPYIFAALNSAKVMVVLGTKPEYFNAVWVKNEWSRYLALVRKSNGKKILIPAYRDMDPYDLPEEFSHLQAQDMSKLGFMQDLIRGINKILEADKIKEKPKGTVIVNNPQGIAVDTLLKRAYLSLEEGDWERANDFCEQVLNQDPENAQVYLAKLLIDLKVRRIQDLSKLDSSFEKNTNYIRALRYGSDELKDSLGKVLAAVDNNRKEKLYNKALNDMHSVVSEDAFKRVSLLFEELGEYKDSAELKNRCLEKAESVRKDLIYNNASTQMEQRTVSSLEQAIASLETIRGWKESEKLIEEAKRRIESINEEQKAHKEAEKKRKKTFAFASLLTALVGIAVAVYVLVITPSMKYNSAVKKLEQKDYYGAYEVLSDLGDYKDSKELIDNYRQDINYALLDHAEIGDTVTFGKYEQDNDSDNGKEDIEWLVLDQKDNQLLLISAMGIDSRKYHNDLMYVTWKMSNIRNWLNTEFVETAFSADESERIITEQVIARSSLIKGTDQGDNTEDKVFLLSYDEVLIYFKNTESRKCAVTEYAKSKKVRIEGGTNNCSWLLRTLGRSRQQAVFVKPDGTVDEEGTVVNNTGYVVRPVIWVSTSEVQP